MEKIKTIKPYENPNYKKGKSKTIFTVHAREKLEPTDLTRTFGWYAKLQDALNAVTNNECDIYECAYSYVVIEEVQEGIHGPAIKEWWFQWDDKEKYFHPIAKPKETNNIVNWGIG